MLRVRAASHAAARACTKLNIKDSDMQWEEKAARIHQEYLRRAQAKGELETEDDQVRFLALAICGEAGELANLIKKMWRGDGAKVRDIRDEIADIQIYLRHLATHLGIDINAACHSKLLEVEKRLETKRRCRFCGCTDDDCSGCINKTGEPCHWIDKDVCSACAVRAAE
jgi:NTP pyrophosphatase (non-canonical NTP hydrolase)